MKRVDADQIRAEMVKIGAIQPRDDCRLRGYIVHGGTFTNWIVFTGNDGHVVDTGHLKKGTWHFGDNIEPLHTGVDYHYKLHSNCIPDGSSEPHKWCGWGQRVTNDGRSLMCEDAVLGDKPANESYDDLQVHLDPGYGTWRPDGERSDTGWIQIPDVCGEAPVDPEPECSSDEDCPDGQICVDGKCVDGCRSDDDCPGDATCVDGKCKNPDPTFEPPATSDYPCNDGYTAIWENGKPICYADCHDPNAQLTTGGECICKDGYLYDEELKKCREECDPTPPYGTDGDCEEDPCEGVICTPPQVCTDGECKCPEGTKLAGCLCIPDDPCFGILCKPNATCSDGTCVCDEGYKADDQGNCILELPEECQKETDCCPSNATIMLGAGQELGGGGGFKVNRECDKTITFWLDPLSDAITDDWNCDNCSCNAELTYLMEIVLELKAELALLQQNAANCLERDDCSGFDSEPPPLPEDPCKDHVASGKPCDNDKDCPDCEKCVTSGRINIISPDIEPVEPCGIFRRTS